jgi:hypothetical protein
MESRDGYVGVATGWRGEVRFSTGSKHDGDDMYKGFTFLCMVS